MGCALSETPVYFLIIILSRFEVVFVEDVWTWAVSLRMTIKPIRLEDYHFRGGYEQRKWQGWAVGCYKVVGIKKDRQA